MNSKIYIGNIQPNPKEFKIWVNEEGSIKTYDTTQGTWSEIKGGASNTQPAPAEKITFTVIDGAGTETTYTAEKGMTWAQFITSSYNVNSWTSNEYEYIHLYYWDNGLDNSWGSGESDTLVYVNNGTMYDEDNYVKQNDFIIADHNYGIEHDSWGVGGGGGMP